MGMTSPPSLKGKSSGPYADDIPFTTYIVIAILLSFVLSTIVIEVTIHSYSSKFSSVVARASTVDRLTRLVTKMNARRFLLLSVFRKMLRLVLGVVMFKSLTGATCSS